MGAWTGWDSWLSSDTSTSEIQCRIVSPCLRPALTMSRSLNRLGCRSSNQVTLTLAIACQGSKAELPLLISKKKLGKVEKTFPSFI